MGRQGGQGGLESASKYPPLSNGALPKILQGGDSPPISIPLEPTLQIVDIEPVTVPGTSSVAYNLMISDGQFATKQCVIEGNVADRLMQNRYLDKLSIVKFKNFYIRKNRWGHNVLFVLELVVLQSGSEVKQVIGAPIEINHDGTMSTPIASLNPHLKSWTIKALVLKVERLYQISNGESSYSFHLVDETAEIMAYASLRSPQPCQAGQVYLISTPCDVVPATVDTKIRIRSNRASYYQLSFKPDTFKAVHVESPFATKSGGEVNNSVLNNQEESGQTAQKDEKVAGGKRKTMEQTLQGAPEELRTEKQSRTWTREMELKEENDRLRRDLEQVKREHGLAFKEKEALQEKLAEAEKEKSTLKTENERLKMENSLHAKFTTMKMNTRLGNIQGQLKSSVRATKIGFEKIVQALQSKIQLQNSDLTSTALASYLMEARTLLHQKQTEIDSIMKQLKETFDMAVVGEMAEARERETAEYHLSMQDMEEAREKETTEYALAMAEMEREAKQRAEQCAEMEREAKLRAERCAEMEREAKLRAEQCAAIRRLLQCNICHTVTDAMMQCIQGHIICYPCFGRLIPRRCVVPTCTANRLGPTFPTTRNLVAEQVNQIMRTLPGQLGGN